MPPSMQPSSSNDFLPAAAGMRSFADAGEDDFDVAQLSAIRKEQKEALEHLESHYNSKQTAIETKVRGEVDQLFQQFQHGMQQLYVGLTQNVNATIDTQVQLRLEQERLRREHDATKKDVEAKYHDEAAKLITSTSHGRRQSKSFPRLPSQILIPTQGPLSSHSHLSTHGPPPGQHPSHGGPPPTQRSGADNTPRSSNFTPTNSGQHVVSPAPSTLNTQSFQQVVQPRAQATNTKTRERVPQQLPRQEYRFPLPTPLATPGGLAPQGPQQRRLVPAGATQNGEPRPIEPRPIEPRPTDQRRVESRSIEPRNVEPRAIESRPPEQRPIEPRPIDHRRVESRSIEPRNVETRAIELCPTEQRPVEPRPGEQREIERPAEQCPTQPRPTEQRVSEPQVVGTPSAEPLNLEASPTEKSQVEESATEQHSVERQPAQQRPAQQVYVEACHTQPIAPCPVSEESGKATQIPTHALTVRTMQRLSETPTIKESGQDLKRKAVEDPTNNHAPTVPRSKRPRSRELPTEEARGTASLPTRSPRSTRKSLEATNGIRVSRTITFEELYQNGLAPFKHKIFMWPKDSGSWYIVRCDEHGVHFKYNHPMHGAAKHVHSPQHGGLEKTYDLAMQVCGHRVLNCNAELAKLNNDEFQRAIEEDNYQAYNENLLTKESKKRRLNGTPAKIADPAVKAATISPSVSAKNTPPPLPGPLEKLTGLEECKFYLGYWTPTKKYYMLIMLPIRQDGSLREAGLKELKLQDTDLMSHVPKCYSTDRLSLQIKGWQHAYADNGPKADKREYPVMFFDSSVQKHSVGWLSATKLKPVDLFNPPEGVDKRQLTMAREWYATRMMNRKDWEQFKLLGPGEAVSPTSSEGEVGKSDQWPALRSARTDEISPIRDKSSGPGHFFGSGSSEEGSDIGDAEDPMTMDVGPIPEPLDSNYVEDGMASDDSDIELEEATRPNAGESDINEVIRPGRRGSSRPGSRNVRGLVGEGGALENSATCNEGSGQMEKAIGTQIAGSHGASTGGQTKSKQARPEVSGKTDHQQETIAVVPKQDEFRSSVQAKAVAAIKEAASQSRASSEAPKPATQNTVTSGRQAPRTSQTQARPVNGSRPPLTDHNRSRSEDTLVRGGQKTHKLIGSSKLNEGHASSGEPDMMGKERGSAQTSTPSGSPSDLYKKFAAIGAEMSKEQSTRASSAPVHQGDKIASKTGPSPLSVPAKGTAPCTIQRMSPPSLQTMSPPLSRPSTIASARSLSTTPTNGWDSGRGTPKIVIPGPEDMGKWRAVRTSSSSSLSTQGPRVSIDTSGQSGEMADSSMADPPQRDTQLGTPIHDKQEKQESFDVSEFHDSNGTSWSRGSPTEPLVRLVTDPMRKWAETPQNSQLRIVIEPAQIERIDTAQPGASREKERVQLVTKTGRKLVLTFETNAASGRSQGAAIQGRKFVAWVKENNGDVEWVDDTDSRPSSRRESHFDEQSVTVR